MGAHGAQRVDRAVAGLAGAGRRPAVIREPLVRSVHSYAFAVLRLAAQRAGGPPPRLVTSAEQDAIIAELLAGEIADGRRRLAGRTAGGPGHRRFRRRAA